MGMTCRIGWCEVTIGLMMLTLLVLSLLGLYDGINATNEPCIITSLPIDYACIYFDTPYAKGYYSHYFTYNITVAKYNLSTTTYYYCDMQSCDICLGNESLGIGIVRECFRRSLSKQYTIIGNYTDSPLQMEIAASSLGLTLFAAMCSLFVFFYYYNSKRCQKKEEYEEL